MKKWDRTELKTQLTNTRTKQPYCTCNVNVSRMRSSFKFRQCCFFLLSIRLLLNKNSTSIRKINSYWNLVVYFFSIWGLISINPEIVITSLREFNKQQLYLRTVLHNYVTTTPECQIDVISAQLLQIFMTRKFQLQV